MPLIQIPHPKPYIHQGPTIQPTHPVPPVSQPDRQRFVDLQQTRYVLAARVDVHQGPTKQQTYLFPPNQPEPARTLGRAEVPLFEPPSTQTLYRSLDQGPTIQQTYVFPTNEPEPTRTLARLMTPLFDPRSTQAWIDLHQGPTKLATFPVPPPGTVPAQWFWWPSPAFVNVNLRLTGPRVQIDPVPIPQAVPIPGVTQRPEAWFGRTASVFVDQRWMVGPHGQVDQGPTKLSTDPIPPVDGPPDGWWFYRGAAFLDARRFTGPTKQTDGPPSLATFPVPPVTQIEMTAYVLRTDRRFLVDVTKRLEGPTVQDTIPTPGVSQPQAWFGATAAPFLPWRWMTGPTPQFTGATTQQTSLFPPNQPDWNSYVPRERFRAFTGPQAQLLGLTITAAQTYEFLVSQPELTAFGRLHALRYLVAARAQLDQGAPSQQTYEFKISQPEWQGFLRLESSRLQRPTRDSAEGLVPFTHVFVPAQPDFHYYVRVTPAPALRPVEGATLQQTYVFPTNQPELVAFALREFARRATGSVRWPLDTFLPALRIPAIIRWLRERLGFAHFGAEALGATGTLQASAFAQPRFKQETIADAGLSREQCATARFVNESLL